MRVAAAHSFEVLAGLGTEVEEEVEDGEIGEEAVTGVEDLAVGQEGDGGLSMLGT